MRLSLVFDTYKPHSLKEKTRERRRQGNAPIQYQIADDTNIKHIPLTRFLSHEKTKADLTDYLAKATLEYKKNSPKLFITSASGQTRSNRNMHFEDNNHEEADTLMICLAAEASQRCPDAQLVFFTSDTDVLVLAVAHYDKLCKRTLLSMVSGTVDMSQSGELWAKKRRKLYLYSTHSLERTTLEADVDLPRALMKLPVEGDLTQEVKDEWPKFVCSRYCPKGIHITSIPDLR